MLPYSEVPGLDTNSRQYHKAAEVIAKAQVTAISAKIDADRKRADALATRPANKRKRGQDASKTPDSHGLGNFGKSFLVIRVTSLYA